MSNKPTPFELAVLILLSRIEERLGRNDPLEGMTDCATVLEALATWDLAVNACEAQVASDGDLPITALNLFPNTHHVLSEAGITTIGQLAEMSSDELLDLRNVGLTSLWRVRRELSKHGLRLRDDPPYARQSR